MFSLNFKGVQQELLQFLLGVKSISSHAHKTGSLYLLGFLFKVSNEHPRPLYLGVPVVGEKT